VRVSWKYWLAKYKNQVVCAIGGRGPHVASAGSLGAASNAPARAPLPLPPLARLRRRQMEAAQKVLG